MRATFPTIFVLGMVLCSCGVQRRLHLDVQEARLVAGGETWDLHYPKEPLQGSISELARFTQLQGFAPNTKTSVSFSSGGSLSVHTAGHLVFDGEASFYQATPREKQPLLHSIRNVPEIAQYYIHVEPPETIPRVHVAKGSGSWGGTLADETVEEVAKNDHVLHHFHYEFAVDGVSHVLDVAFRRKVETDLFIDFGVPATP